MSVFGRLFNKNSKDEKVNNSQSILNNDTESSKNPTKSSESLDLSRNQEEIIFISQKIRSAPDLTSLQQLYNSYRSYPHPQIKSDFGISFLIKNEKILARNALLEGAYYGIEYPCAVYYTPFVDSVGQCFYHLLTQFNINNEKIGKTATELCYLYLSQCINLFPREPQDSYRSRALLFRKPEIMHSYIIYMLNTYAETKAPRGVYPLSDFYYSSQATGSPYKDAINFANEIHTNLDDAEVGDKEADDYSLRELAEIGELLHKTMFNKIEVLYKKNKLNISKSDLESAVSL